MEEIEVIGVAVVNQNGGVSLPASIRKKMGLEQGSKVVWIKESEGVRLVSEDEYLGMIARLDIDALRSHHVRTLDLQDLINKKL